MKGPTNYPSLGALPSEGGTTFRVWAPGKSQLEVVLEPSGRHFGMTALADGVFERRVEEDLVGAHYFYRVDGDALYPDPASRYQPNGVHGPSQVIDPTAFAWHDRDWQGVPQAELVFYELHVGTFTREGTYDAVRRKLPYLRELGITALELMPVNEFPGERGWGYDPAALFAPAHSYGSPDALRQLVDEAHAQGLAVFLDVVYNHFGPDGAYAVALAPEFLTERHHTPWGKAVNLDGPGSRQVRAFFLENALAWLHEYHFDGFRLDATFALVDDSRPHFLAELAAVVDTVPGWRRRLVAEDPRDLNTLLLPRNDGGDGLDAVWSDDFHHQVRRILTGDDWGYFAPYSDRTEDVATTVEQGWFFTGSGDEARGSDPAGLRSDQFVFCLQNHDQVGNRPVGERLHQDIMLPAYRAASALLLFCPELPLLFMGQEWAAATPFQYFTDHQDELGRLVRDGRREEFKDFPGFHDEVPDPQDPATFWRSKLDWSEPDVGEHACTLALYRDLLRLRRELSGEVKARSPVPGGLALQRGRHLLLVTLREDVDLPAPGEAEPLWCSEDDAYSGAPKPPEAEGEVLHFPVPAALLFRLGS
ncbi:MAG TPA: malto-oligosyltrehalose trehalohydrolase [Trueperaceae bacterium]